MGCHPNINHEKFPEQGKQRGKRVRVMFYFTEPYCYGVCIRDDKEEPFRTIFQLDDGRVVDAVECQWAPLV